MVIRRVPVEDRDMVRRKLLAWDLVGGGAQGGGRIHWGIDRRWYGDYLSQESNVLPQYSAMVQDLLARDRANNIVFSCRMLKINKFKKQTDRFLLVSEKKIYKVDAAKIKVMRDEGLDQVLGLTCGSKDNQLVVLHMRDKNDLVFCLSVPEGEDRVGELVAVLASMKGKEAFRVRVADEVHCHMGGKPQTVLIQPDQAVPAPDFKKSKTGFVFSYPA